LTGGAKPIFEALRAESRVQLTAVGDRDAEAAARCAEAVGAEPYTDYRSLIVEHKLDALFVATPHFATHGYLKLAAAKGTPVWKQSPLARRFEEALTLVRTFERPGEAGTATPLVIARAWPAEPALERAGDALAELGKPFLIEGRVFVCRPEDLDWRGDSERAGAGVLLHEAYGLIDAVVHWFGPPTEVYAATRRVSRPQTRYPYDTEDTAVLVLKYTDGAIASFACCWTSGPPLSQLTIRATAGTLVIERDRVCVLDRAGEPKCASIERTANPYTHPIRAFLDGLAGDPNRMPSRARDHLWTMAVIETAYLSSRTGDAESPAKWFEMLRADEMQVSATAPPPEQPQDGPEFVEPIDPDS
jgi:predicted dehydrogenase